MLIAKRNHSLFKNYTTLREIFADRSLRFGSISGFSYGTTIDQLIKTMSPHNYQLAGIQLQVVGQLSINRISYMLIAPEEIETLIRSGRLNVNDFSSIAISDAPVGNKRYLMCNKVVSDEIIIRLNKSQLEVTLVAQELAVLAARQIVVNGGRTVSAPRKSHGKEEGKMIKVSVLYPNTEGCKFDMEYYCNSHIPMVQEKLGAALKGVAVEQGLGGAEPGSRATYVAMGHLLLDSVEAFQGAFGPHAEAIMGDIPNYTDTQPTIQISEVKI